MSSLKFEKAFKKIFFNPIFYLWLAVLLFNLIFIFNFQGVAEFRDTKFFPNTILNNPFYTGNFWVYKSTTAWLFLNLPIHWYWRIFYSLMFSFGLVFSFVFLKKILILLFSLDFKKYLLSSDLNNNLGLKTISKEVESFNLEFLNYKNLVWFNFILFLLTSLYFFNPYVLERFFMGQYFVLFGHSFFIVAFYFCLNWIIKTFSQVKNLNSNLNFKENTIQKEKLKSVDYKIKKNQKLLNSLAQKDFWFMLWAVSFTFMISPHHGVFLCFLLALTMFLLFFYKLIETRKQGFKGFFFAIFNLDNLKVFLVFLLNFFLFLGNYARWIDSYFDDVIQGNNKSEIIKSFSLQTFNISFGEHLFLATAGRGSWMSPMTELTRIAESLGILRHFSFYYNFLLQFLVISILSLFFLFFLKKNFWDSLKIDQSLKFEAQNTKTTPTLEKNPENENNLKNNIQQKTDSIKIQDRRLNSKLEKDVKILTFKRLGNLNWALVFLTFLAFGTWFLNFGYSRPFFTTINQLFFALPGTYTFREAGKFYSFFLAFVIILIAFYLYQIFFLEKVKLNFKQFQKSKTLQNKKRKEECLGKNIQEKNIQILNSTNSNLKIAKPDDLIFNSNNRKTSNFKITLTSIALGLFLISNLLPFFFISKHLNYVQHPEIFDKVNNYCQKNPEKNSFVFISTDLYLTTSYSPSVFTVSPSTYYFPKCKFIDLNKASLQNTQKGNNTLLNQTKKSRELDLMFDKLIAKKSTQEDFDTELKKFLKINKIDNILIETYTNDRVKVINQALESQNQPKEMDGTIFWYQI